MTTRLLFVFLSLFSLAVNAQQDSLQTLDILDVDSTKVTSQIQTSVRQSGTLEEDTLKIDTEAIYIKVENSTLEAKKKKPVTSLVSYVAAKPEDMKAYLIERMKENYDVKLKKKKGLLIAEEVNLAEISTREINMYAGVEQVLNETAVNVAFELNNHYFLEPSRESDDFEKARTFVHHLVKGYYLNYYNQLLETVQDQYDALVKQKETLLAESRIIHQKNTRYNSIQALNNKRIADDESTILKLESRVSVNEGVKELNEQKIVEYEKRRTEINNNKGTTSEELEAALDELKDLDKDIQKAGKQVEKAQKAILKDNAMIVKAKASIETAKNEVSHHANLKEQGEKELAQKENEIVNKEAQISKKQELLDAIKIKLRNIY